MNSFYPITLRLSGKKVVVVGGGKVAERKAAGLLRTEAVITVVSPEITEGLKKLVESGQVHWLKKLFSYDDMKDAFMIFAATNDCELNQSIKNAANPHQLVMMVDDPDRSDFHVPSQVRRGRLNIAVSTGGASPTLAKVIREQLSKEFDERYEDYLEFLFQTRQKIVTEVDDPSLKRKLLRAIVSSEFLNSENREEEFIHFYERYMKFKKNE